MSERVWYFDCQCLYLERAAVAEQRRLTAAAASDAECMFVCFHSPIPSHKNIEAEKAFSGALRQGKNLRCDGSAAAAAAGIGPWTCTTTQVHLMSTTRSEQTWSDCCWQASEERTCSCAVNQSANCVWTRALEPVCVCVCAINLHLVWNGFS